MHKHQFLKSLHELIRPRSYVETGVDRGQSMTLSRTRSIGIDPAYNIDSKLFADVLLARTTSDEFFARPVPTLHLRRKIIDLAFIDGMHLAEYALRDYLAIERFTNPASVIVFDDMLPRNVDEAARYRHTGAWTGDVYKAAQALRDFCPDLVLLEVNTQPTGLIIVLVPNAARNGVLREYDAWLDVAVTPDPQDVPAEILDRTRALDPTRLLASPGWRRLPELRTGRGASRRAAQRAEVLAAFADVLGAADPPPSS